MTSNSAETSHEKLTAQSKIDAQPPCKHALTLCSRKKSYTVHQQYNCSSAVRHKFTTRTDSPRKKKTGNKFVTQCKLCEN